MSVSGASTYAVEVPVGQDRFAQTWTAPDPEDAEGCAANPRSRLHRWTNPPLRADELLLFQLGETYSVFDCASAADSATPWVDIGPVEEGDIVRAEYSGAGQVRYHTKSGYAVRLSSAPPGHQ